jgi:hypothetical protein
MAQVKAHSTAHDRVIGSELWMLALATVLLGTGALLLLAWKPAALGIALAVGLMAVGARQAFTQVKTREHSEAEASSAVASTGLVIAAVAVAPLLVFALLWAGLLLLLGAMWVLNAIGVI